VRYVGQAVVPGAAPEWSGPLQPQRLFAYLRKAYPLTDRVISALVRLPRVQVICFHDGLSLEQQRAATHLRYIQTPVDLGQLLPAADAVICHGGGLQALSLQFGKPVLALPLHTEQYLSARQAEKAGASLVYLARGERPDFLPMIRQLLTLPTLAASAQAIAAAHNAREPDILAAVAGEVEMLLNR
jgi:UDP:flavonoid glycosyltransferase YjiC (YdhE family)